MITLVIARFAIVTDENSRAAYLMVLPFRVSFLLLAAAMVNVIYRFGLLKPSIAVRSVGGVSRESSAPN